ncbi:hypothetical protein [Actinomyces gerencseriae]|uniref:variant leucine-rich repeat-containing protein n=1 Tax=Actinomyces gerencseriae TaxID=52769 RepID=UPI0023F50653|nr:hypothetical protein [Actinomyces gerencseriae]
MSQAQDDLVAAASNPNAELATLHELANNYPGLRPYIAANPRTYPALLEWLGTLGDPAVDAALARRYGPAQPLTTAAADGSTQVLSAGQIGPQSPQGPGQQQPLAETQYQQPTQATQAIQQTQYQQPTQAAQPQYAQPQYAQAPQQQYAQAPQQQAAQPTPEGLFGIGEAAEEEDAGPRPTLWLWILGAIAIVAVVALVVWFVLSNHGGGNNADDDGDQTGTSQQADDPTSDSPSKKPTPSASASPTPSPSASPSQKLVAPAPADAVEMSSFTAPSGNITCTLGTDSVSCTIKDHSFVPQDASCGNSSSAPVTWTVGKDGVASGSCGSSFAGSGASLNYGSAAKNSTFACTSSEDGIECWSQISGQGFKMSREDSKSTKQSGQR